MSGTNKLPEVFTRAQGRSTGLTDRQMDRRLAAGDLVAVRRGVLATAGHGELATDASVPQGPVPSVPSAAGLPIDVRAALLGSPGRNLIISHESAARLWGLPQPLGG